MTARSCSQESWSNRGFTLFELAIVITIIALVTGMAMTTGISVVATARITATQKKMDAIDKALMQYRTINDRLPCPADLTIAPGAANFGIEAANPNACTGGTPAANFTATGVTNTLQQSAEGAVPAISLGLPPDFMVDGWGNRFRYAVDVSMTANEGFAYVPLGCLNGAITVNDGNGNARSKNSIYALISHGPNGHGAYSKNGTIVSAGDSTADELTNCHCNSSGATTTVSGVQTIKPATYVQKLPAYDSGHVGNALYYFDDLVSYRERWQMQTAWDGGGVCQYIYVSDYSNNVIEQFNMQGKFMQAIGSAGSGSGQFNGPSGIKVDSSGNLYVADQLNNRVQKLSPNGTFIFGIGAGYQGMPGAITNALSGAGTFHWPTGVALDSLGNIYVADKVNYRVQKFNSGGQYLWMSGGSYINGSTTTCYACTTQTSQATCNSSVSGPPYNACAANGNKYCFCQAGGSPPVWPNFLTQDQGIIVDNSGNLYVSNYTAVTTYEVNTVNPDGTSNNTSGFNAFGNPRGMTIAANGNLYVANDSTYQISVYYKPYSWATLYTFINNGHCASFPCSNGKFFAPRDITTDVLGNFYVLDTGGGAGQVDKFNSSGSFIGSFGYGILNPSTDGGLAIGR